LSDWEEGYNLKLGDLVISIGRAFTQSNSSGVSRKDVGIVIGFVGKEEDQVKVYWQRSRRHTCMSRDWLMRLSCPHLKS